MLELLKSCFGFSDIMETDPAELSGHRFPIGRLSHHGAVPIVIAPPAATESRKAGIDEALREFGDDTRRRSATQLLQEYLNAEDRALWGIASDGSTLRLMRDNASLTRPAWIEADLEKIFTEGLFADFSALWLLIHANCFGARGASPSDCRLEQWRERAQLDGTAAREKLRLGVEAALRELGSGFLEEPTNGELREALHTGETSRQVFYEELLRLVYRLIFLFAAEDRNLLHTPTAQDAARKAYQRGYSVGRLRERCVKSTALDRHYDTWGGLKCLIRSTRERRAPARPRCPRWVVHPNEPHCPHPLADQQPPTAQGHLESHVVPARRTAHDARELARHADRGAWFGIRESPRTHPGGAPRNPRLHFRDGCVRR